MTTTTPRQPAAGTPTEPLSAVPPVAPTPGTGAHASDTPPPAAAATHLPRRGMSLEPVKDEVRREVGAPREERLDLVGGLLAGICVALLLSAGLGVIGTGWGPVTAYLCFAGLYLVLVRLGNAGPATLDRLVSLLLWTVGMAVIGLLGVIIAFVATKGWPQLFHWSFYRDDMGTSGPLSPLTEGGIHHAIIGTLEQIGIALLVCAPLSLLTAVFLNEIGGRFARFVRTIVEAMTALPSVVAGLFVYASLITLMGGFNGFAAAMAISVLMLPIMIRSADSVLRLVPGNLREAGYALGASQFSVVWRVVLPTIRSGLATALILGTAHGIGETAPVLLTAGLTKNTNWDPFHNPQTPLTLAALEFIKSPQPNDVIRGFATATVLLVLVIALFTLARVLGGQEAGKVTPARLRRLAKQSESTLARIEGRTTLTVTPGAAGSTTPEGRS